TCARSWVVKADGVRADANYRRGADQATGVRGRAWFLSRELGAAQVRRGRARLRLRAGQPQPFGAAYPAWTPLPTRPAPGKTGACRDRHGLRCGGRSAPELGDVRAVGRRDAH